VAYETKPLSQPRNGATWRPAVYHDWQHREAPYSKALSSDVSRKGSAALAGSSSPTEPVKTVGKFGASGMSEKDVEAVVEAFVKGRN
jgi:hypothetical protein